MSNELTTVRLSGKLGTMFGRVHRIAVSSAQEAALALSATVPGFERELLTSADKGVRYAVFYGKRNISEDEIESNCEKQEIRIAPVMQGSKRGGLFQTILGAALIGLAAWQPQFLGLAKGWWSASTLGGIGISLALGGVMQMLSPQQRGLSTRDNPENGASYNFNGPVNTTAQGNPVPVLYGEMIVGSAVASAGIFAENQS